MSIVGRHTIECRFVGALVRQPINKLIYHLSAPARRAHFPYLFAQVMIGSDTPFLAYRDVVPPPL